MYLLLMDRVTREDIAAAAAARQELGSSYDDVIAEGLIERIGAEIDKRVDARLEGRRRSRRTDVGELERRRTLWKGAAVGAAAVGLPILLASHGLYEGKRLAVLAIVICLAIAAGYVIASWAHAMR